MPATIKFSTTEHQEYLATRRADSTRRNGFPLRSGTPRRIDKTIHRHNSREFRFRDLLFTPRHFRLRFTERTLRDQSDAITYLARERSMAQEQAAQRQIEQWAPEAAQRMRSSIQLIG